MQAVDMLISRRESDPTHMDEIDRHSCSTERDRADAAEKVEHMWVWWGLRVHLSFHDKLGHIAFQLLGLKTLCEKPNLLCPDPHIHVENNARPECWHIEFVNLQQQADTDSI